MSEQIGEKQQNPTNSDILDKADDVDKAIIRIKLQYPAISNSELAKRMNLHRDTVTKRLKKPQVVDALHDIQRTALQILMDAQSDAARQMVKMLMTSRDQRIVLLAARDILKGVLAEKFVVERPPNEVALFFQSLSEAQLDKITNTEKSEEGD